MDGRLKRIGKTLFALSKNTILVSTQKFLKPCVMKHLLSIKNNWMLSEIHGDKDMSMKSKLGICTAENSKPVDRRRNSPLSYRLNAFFDLIRVLAPKWRSWATLTTQNVK